MKDFVLTAWTIDPADFRLRLILGGSIGRDLRPAAHPRLVGQVLLPEGAFQVTLLALDHLALDQVHHQRQEEDDPQRVPQSGYPGIDHGQREVGRVAAVAERTCRGQPGNGPVGAYRCVGVAHSFAPPAPDQRPPTYEWPADDTHHAARQEGDVGSSVEYQPQEQWKEVDQRWRHFDARVIWLVVGHASSFARFLQHNILLFSSDVGDGTFFDVHLYGVLKSSVTSHVRVAHLLCLLATRVRNLSTPILSRTRCSGLAPPVQELVEWESHYEQHTTKAAPARRWS